jgi:hypothetical protein
MQPWRDKNMRILSICVFTAILLVTLCTNTFAQDYQPVPEGLQAFLVKLHDLSVAKDLEGLEMCVLPYFGMRAYGNTITRMDFADARNMDYEREFRYEAEGLTELQTLKLTEFLLGEYRCFGLLAALPITKGILLTEAQRWDDDMPSYFEKEGCDFLVFTTEEYANGDTVYCVDFSPYESQHVGVGKIGGNWYLLSFAPFE